MEVEVVGEGGEEAIAEDKMITTSDGGSHMGKSEWIGRTWRKKGGWKSGGGETVSFRFGDDLLV